MQTLKCIIFTDGRPGHEKQSQGIVHSLEKYVDVDLEEIRVPHNKFFREALSYLRYILQAPNPLCQTQTADLLIGTGSRTHISLLTCKRALQAKTIVCMSPHTLLRKNFDLCLVPTHDDISAAENVFHTIGPPNRAQFRRNRTPGKGLILVGGVDSSSHYWEQSEIVTNISEIVNRSGMKSWTISSSPRTPDETERELGILASRSPDLRFYAFSETPKGWIEKRYADSETVWITGDSISMVYEALSAGCRVGILPVRWKKRENKFQKSEQYLVERNRVITFSGWRDGTQEWADHHPLNEADRCAKEILRRWWPKNLP